MWQIAAQLRRGYSQRTAIAETLYDRLQVSSPDESVYVCAMFTDNSSQSSSLHPVPLRLGEVLMPILWLAVLWLAGGSSRSDATGQVPVILAAWAIVIGMIVFARRPEWRQARAVYGFLAAAAALMILQLLPLWPAAWLALPGREVFASAAEITGEAQPWRPLSISPGGTVQSLGFLVVPAATLALCGGMRLEQHWRVALTLLCLIGLSALLGLMQFSGVQFNHPLVNDIPGMVSANFANRNHLGLFCAIGCIVAPAWALQSHDSARWKIAAAFALVILFGLIVLATGSRAGLLLGAMGVVIGIGTGLGTARAEYRRLSKSMRVLLPVGIVVLVSGLLLLSIVFDRAASIDRLLSLNTADDLRGQTLPFLVAIATKYFPVGAGFGTFDELYRIDEPLDLLSLQYFNHAHNDLLEVVLEGGLPGLLLLVAAVGWWAWRSYRAWRPGRDQQGAILPRAGSGMLLLVFVASIWDYPARTPMIMAVVVIAAIWLCRPGSGMASSADNRPIDRPSQENQLRAGT